MKLLKNIEEINKLIKTSNGIFIMGHRFIDLDALAASIAMQKYVKVKNKKSTIIINDIKFEKGVKKVLDKFKNEYLISRSSKIKNKINKDSLLIIVDTNKEYLLQDKALLSLFDKVIVIDHHDPNEQSIKKGLVIIDPESSSTCEMITALFDKEKIEITKDVATLLLSGIVLDTNNFVIRSTNETFRTSYLLTKAGAEPQQVQFLLKQDLKNYVARQRVITNVKQYKNILITAGKSSIRYRREDLARIADTLIQFDKIEASFVIGRLENHNIGISARSLGNINVGKVLENLNGGGDNNEAGALIENSRIKDVEKELMNIIKSLN